MSFGKRINRGFYELNLFLSDSLPSKLRLVHQTTRKKGQKASVNQGKFRHNVPRKEITDTGGLIPARNKKQNK